MNPQVHDDEKVIGKVYDIALLKRLWPMVRPHRRLGFLALLIGFGTVGAEVSLPWLQKYAVDVNIKNGDVTGLVWTALGYLGLMLASYGLSCASIVILATVGQRVMYDLRVTLFKHLQGLSLSFYNRNAVGRLVTRLSSDVDLVTQMFTDVMINSARDVLILVAALGMMLVCDWRLTLKIFIVLPAMVGVSSFFRKYVRQGFRETRRTLAICNAYLQENIAGVRTVQAFVREDRNAGKYQQLNHDYLTANLKTIFCFSLYLPSVDFIARMGSGLVVLFGAQSVFAGHTQIGTVFAFLGWVEMFFRPVRHLSQRYNVMQMAMASGERICGLLETQPDIVAPPRPRPLQRARGRIEFRDVWFAYTDDEWVLRGVSFVVEPGETFALVGRTGSGKSTIINLLCRFYDVQRGRILLDGVDIREYDPIDLRRQISLVQQDIYLFSGSARFNIDLGDPDISPQRVLHAAQLVNADRFIRRLEPAEDNEIDDALPPGYSARLGERGVTLSVGERQLIAFARALATDPAILVLDEATSSVDTETERLIQDALNNLLHGRSSLIVAHRLSTIERADRILVLARGEIREQGTHNELLHHDGLYAQLYELQYKNSDPTQAKTADNTQPGS